MAALDFERAVFRFEKRASFTQFASSVFSLNDILNWGPFVLLVAGLPGIEVEIRNKLYFGGLATIAGATVRLRAQVQAEQSLSQRTGQVRDLRVRAGLPARSAALNEAQIAKRRGRR